MQAMSDPRPPTPTTPTMEKKRTRTRTTAASEDTDPIAYNLSPQIQAHSTNCGQHSERSSYLDVNRTGSPAPDKDSRLEGHLICVIPLTLVKSKDVCRPRHLVGSMSVNNSSATSDAPILAYVSRGQLNHVRRNCFRVLAGPNRIYNGPVHRLQALRSKMLMPKNQDEDQYILAVMITLAQQAAYSETTASGATFNPRDLKIRVLSTSEDDDSFVVYTGIVPAALLRMFHEPEKAPRGDTKIQISYAQVPIWPVLGLKERLGQALGSEVVGDFDALNMETYEDELPPTPETPSPKRRREVLTEVFNASFSEDRDSDSPVEMLGKRRRLEEAGSVEQEDIAKAEASRTKHLGAGLHDIMYVAESGRWRIGREDQTGLSMLSI
ncbi:hypothetical protein DL766_006514 [Monosporascus sp. MC13-8B]|uniref:Uncharacterized protein n=1 Tax=Monosporascus cannonballus TaxID=155416 RepID=A0ABY0H8N7_9PEZI|nr:hypothetical protein DL762_005203 [Monosporascus cannonballus]RYO88719.1 hypothetical protein DL763_005888 [Monosporascus cannonballus]RYP27139.1 hypothetical protein DL766_006514 [Monosporascus sp. MC13-8B]